MGRHATGPVLLLLLLLWTSSPAYAGQVYVVRAGDTLWRISHRFGVRPAELAALNGLALTDTIHPGLRLAVPVAAAPASGPLAAPAHVLGPEPVAVASPAPLKIRTTAPSRPYAFSSEAVRVAMALIGRPYRWSGTGDGGFDCSGLVAYVYGALGRPLPHSSFAQYEIGTMVSREALGPGDLVFFRTYSIGASHVGIFVGENRFVHASYARGVIVSSIEELYFRERFIGGRRI
jgi:peptidoglycan DL-endopeptidase LytE